MRRLLASLSLSAASALSTGAVAGAAAVTLALAAFAPAVASAEPVTRADARAVRSVVEGQLAALAADDAGKAFSFASPNIRAMFGDADLFLAMVRTGYPVVYRHASATFLEPAWVDGTLLQGVHLSDASGSVWLAVYQLERQPDKSWRIAGCTVQPADGKLT